MEDSAYRRLHSAWISGNTGSTLEDTLIANLPGPMMVFLLGATHHIFRLHLFACEFILLIIPIILNFTYLSYHTSFLPGLIALALFIYCVFNKRACSYKVILSSTPDRRPSWITNFRACTSIISVICILAVDLNIFPRKFAKTEINGFGLMDLGVGIYVICHGLVHKNSSFRKEIQAMLLLLMLGAIRLFSVKLIGYQEHVSEYGLHWNFFFTLASCRIFSACASYYLKSFSSLILTVIFGLTHHVILVSGGQEWVLSGKSRVNLLDANREGITSILGYLTIYYASLTYKNLMSTISTGSALKKTAFLALCLWVSTYLAARHIGISRRLCNVGYIVWTCTIAITMIFILMGVDILLRSHSLPRVPHLLNAINTWGLLFFLLGNVLTGMINVYCQTLILSTWQSYCLLVMYILLVTLIIYVVDKVN